MVNFTEVIDWHPAYYIANLADNRLIATAETASFLFQGEPYYALWQLIDGKKSILEIIANFEDIPKQALLLHTINELLENGMLQEVAASQSEAAYHLPDYDSEPAVFRFHDGLLEIYCFSGYADPDLPARLAQQLTVRQTTGIVIVDDYLDPRLEAINRAYLQQKRSWLLLKPIGLQPLVGPHFTPGFTPGSQPGPCWQCLADRLLHNQPVRHWLQIRQAQKTLPLPVGYSPQNAALMPDIVLELVPKFIARAQNDHLTAIDPDLLTTQDHPVNRLPQCPHCGNPEISRQRPGEQLELNSSPKTFTSDSGVRTQHPRQTLAALQGAISPLTGIVRDLDPLPGSKQHGVPIYRSSFFKVPGQYRLPDPNAFMQISLGKGISATQSQVSALCESLERYAVQYHGDEPHTFCQAADSALRTVVPHELASFSGRQYARFADPELSESGAAYAVQRYATNLPLHWTPAWSLTRQQYCHVPFSYCYANSPFEEVPYSRFNSNGCAAGNTLVEALLQGFLEVVERDATAIWWYNKLVRPAVAIDKLPDVNLKRLEQSLAADWEYWVLDLTHDFQIPVMAAVARHHRAGTYRLGFGCHLNPLLACQRALTELCQIVAIGDRGPVAFNFDEIDAEPFLAPASDQAAKKLSDYLVVEHADIKDDVLFCVARAKQLGHETLVVDYPRPDIPIRTAKVIIPGLCHIWPQLGNARLYEVPVSLGQRDGPAREDQLNPKALLI